MVTNFHELYEKYAQDIYRFAYWLCGNIQDAEDITSETFVRALTSADEIRTETVKGYLLTIAKNLTFKKLNQSKRFVDLNPSLPTLSNGPEQTVETNFDLQNAMHFLQTISEVDRAALLMYTQNELSYEEISRILGISLAATKVKIHRTRLKLNAHRMKEEENKS
ncbi:MAG: RNA polymerase sigma factor [Anaerolineales bacterium]